MCVAITDGDIGDLQNSQELIEAGLFLLLLFIMVSESWFWNGKGKE